jgi:thiaminase/transcriptional activator TenA
MSFSRELKEKSGKVWEDCYNHPFLQELGRGTLQKEKFKFYLLQDYLYLLEYAKVFAEATAKCSEEKYMLKFSEAQHGILYEEMDTHRAYMKDFGITEKEAEEAGQSLFSKAYTANMLSVAYTGTTAEILAVVFPCAWSYHDYAKRLKKEYGNSEKNVFYQRWIDTYASDEFRDSFDWFYDYLDLLCKNKSEKELKKIEEIFKTSIEFEFLFWEMAYNMKMSY